MAWIIKVFEGGTGDDISDLLVPMTPLRTAPPRPREESTLTIAGVDYRPALLGEPPDVTLTGEGPTYLPRAWVRRYPR